MGYMIEITEDKIEKMSDYVEDMLWAGGELMHCLEKMKGDEGYGERNYNRSGNRGGYSSGSYGNRYGMNYRGGMNYRDEDEDWEEQEMMGERRRGRRRDSMGRYR